jgi:hypothetical protein
MKTVAAPCLAVILLASATDAPNEGVSLRPIACDSDVIILMRMRVSASRLGQYHNQRQSVNFAALLLLLRCGWCGIGVEE